MLKELMISTIDIISKETDKMEYFWKMESSFELPKSRQRKMKTAQLGLTIMP